MKLNRIKLQNFRCFESLEIEFDPRLTVIVAENGIGKTTILDAIATGFGRFLTKLPKVSGIASRETDIRLEQGEVRTPFMSAMFDAEVMEPQNSALALRWTVQRRRDAAAKTAKLMAAQLDPSMAGVGQKQIDDYAARLTEADASSTTYFLPVIAYYGTNRAFPDAVQRRGSHKKQFSRFEALSGALQPDARFKSAFEWFSAMEDVERREREKQQNFTYRQPELSAVRHAIVSILREGFSNPRTEIRPLRFVIDQIANDGMTRTLRLSELSDGFRVTLGLVMDLARRMAQANSSLSAGGHHIVNPLDLPAIVLIDEVDLHLHPKWQQKILTDLMRTFSGAQFIVTTHSPQVLSTVRRENIRVISQDEDGKAIAVPPLAMTYGEPSGDVMHSVMQVDPQPPVIEREDLQRLTEWVDQGQFGTADARRLQQELTTKLGEQHPQLQRLQRSIRRQLALNA